MAVIQIFGFLASLLAAVSVAAGAFASHALKDKLSDRAIEIFETGAKYQMYHALALLFVVVLLRLGGTETNAPWLVAAGVLFLVGIVLFSGSLYGLSLSGVKGLGVITPLGGAAFLAGWGCLAIAALRWGS